jgi:hypothetical protein
VDAFGGGGELAGDGTAHYRDSLYAGIAGLAPALAEIAQYRELRDTEQELSRGVVADSRPSRARKRNPRCTTDWPAPSRR